MSAETPLLAAEDVTRSFGRRLVLDVPAFAVPAGATFALLGSSGAGKSTFLRILGLLDKPTTGRVLLEGRQVRANDRTARMQMAVLFQKPYLFAGSVGDNVEYGLRARGVAAAERRRRAAQALERVGLAGFADRDGRALSGGEAQRVALARALVVEPRVLLLDEPLSYIDPLVKERLVREFADILRAQGTTTVWVTHDQEEAFAVADAVGIMHQGRFVASGPVDEVMALPSTRWAAGFLGMEPPMRGRVVAQHDGMAEVEAHGLRLFGSSQLRAGEDALVAVRPEDVTLFSAEEPLPHSSARNKVEGTVAEMTPKGAMVRVVIAHGDARIASLVSRASAAELRLEPGREVVAVFKAAATRVGAVVAGTMESQGA